MEQWARGIIRAYPSIRRVSAIAIAGVLFLAPLAGCMSAPTYPKAKFKESIIRLCKKEYKLDVRVATVGKTVAIYLPLEDLIDFTFALTKDASEKINDVILSVTRVILSSDAKYDFYVIIAHDIRLPEIQIIIIKSVDDAKRFLLNDVSRDDYSKRMLIDLRLNPQAQKERSIKEVFEKMGLDQKWQEQVMNDFFRSEPTGLGDIGYWNKRFYVKDVSLAEFIAEQLAGRVKFLFRDDKNVAAAFGLRSVKGLYVNRPGRRQLKLELIADQRAFNSPEAQEIAINGLFEALVKMTVPVLRGYRFEDFDILQIVEQNTTRTLEVTKENLELYRKRKITFDKILAENRA